MSWFLIQPIFRIRDFQKMIGQLILVFFLIQSTSGQIPHPHHQGPPQLSQPWLTLDGQRPKVIARGGYSGLYPESSEIANKVAMETTLADVVLHCSLQLSKDGIGFCLSSLLLDNSTTITQVYPKAEKSYDVNGKQMQGHFFLDYPSEEISNNISLTQGIFSRPYLFDGQFPIDTIQQVLSVKPPEFWINVQYSSFYAQHNLDPVLYLEKIPKTVKIDYISSPEIGFLKAMSGKVNKAFTHLVLEFLEANAVEPTTNQTYGAIAKDLASIKLFASGILVPKDYIWPSDAGMYLGPPTTLVTDAHKEGLLVYSYSFANDLVASYNYTYDPAAEYLQFIDNSQFAVDGFLSDFPSTASEAIACLAHNKNGSRVVKGTPLVISHNGASGVYPGSTDLAYQQAVDDGADIIDCSVQMSKDGVAFCLNSTDLAATTTAKTNFLTKSATIPEIQGNSGIFSFDLTWAEIQTLQPLIGSPYFAAGLQRNPANKNKGKFVTLAEFLEFAKQKKVAGVLINIKNAPYLASKKGLSITDAVASALSNATLDKQSTQQVLIQSDDSSVLSTFSNNTAYKRVLIIEEIRNGATKQIVDEIKKIADAVNLRKASIVSARDAFTFADTGIVQELHKANLSVYAAVFRNEFYAIPQDYFSDPYQELATFIQPPIGVDGVVTEYPATASAYLKSPCSIPDPKREYNFLPIQIGTLTKPGNEEDGAVLPPAAAPAPPLDMKDILAPPLPPVSKVPDNTAAAPNGSPAAPAPKNSQTANVANLGLSLVAIMVLSLLSIVC